MRRFFRNWFGNWYAVTIVAALILAALLAFGLPLFVAFFRPLSVRIACAVLVALGWLLWWFLRRRRTLKAADAIAAELAGPNAAEEEGKLLGKRMSEALAKLRASSGRQRDYLYSRPWYVIIGPPGAGKTTALLHSGLRFPFVEQAVKGVGGTRNLDFWFADEAVLVDTAGRYTTQDSDATVDAAGWSAFLSLLKRNRPAHPVNGVIVAIGIDELIRSDCAAIDAHARAVRRRLVEMRRTLEVAVPVYLLLTKADLIAGFTEYFEDLDVEGRRAVFGSTATFANGRPASATLAQAFDTMTQAIADRQARRVFEEVDQRRRGMMIGFPSQLRSLRARLMRFLDGAFVSGEEAAGQLRGFYLTSGLQEGAPLDRILAGMAEVYDQPMEATPSSGSGRAYFLNRLLTEVMFPEAGLVTADTKAKVRRRGQLIGALAAIGVAVALVATAWGVSFARNRAFQAELARQTVVAEKQFREAGVDLAQVREDDADLRAAIPALDTLRNLPRGYAQRGAGGPPLAMTFGLYQRSLSQEALETYRDALRRVMLPRLLLRLETVMKAQGRDPMQLYEPLKVYLMLGQKGPMDAKSVQAWVTGDWANELYPGADSQAERSALARHLSALLEDRDMASVWPNRQPPLDAQLVASARAAVQTLSLADRAYAVLRQKAASAGPAWEAANILSQGDVLAFAAPDQVLSARIPYFFTRAGYEKAYLPGLVTVQQDLKRDLWVVGGADEAGVGAELSNVRPGVAGLYAKDYIAAWEGLITLMRPGAYFSDPAAFGAFTKSPSPMKRVLLELRKNTTFTGGTQAGLARAARYGLNRSRIGRIGQQMNQDRARGIDAGDEISGYFANLQEYVGDGRGSAPIDEFVGAVKSAGQAVMAARSIGGGGGADTTQAQMAAAIASVKAAAASAPPQMQPFVTQAAGGGSAAQVSAAGGAITDAYTQTVLPACREVAQERYPFFGAAPQDAAMVDVLRVFGMGGVIDSFTQSRLKPLIDTEGAIWRWRDGNAVTAALNPSTPEAFARAGELRDLLVGGLPIKVSVASFGTGVDTVEVTSGGTRYRFKAASNQPHPLLWSASGGLPEASVVLYSAAKAATAAPGKPAAAPADPDAQSGTELGRFAAEGPWALFRVMDMAEKQNAGARAIRASFGQGALRTTLAITLPGDRNPFSRAGIWSFRCPASL
ncbi:type VI secretion system membrane subunit TssM [Sphingomonas alpina]|uniref:Type VI secretion system membrane subunit TssM n=1 Tax=Sphingomonas alpina TaxID=653931 RepID=A0A7H0LIS1_9SPHN|nr:type VI secretion system membrane subunit TssM [Sphingomonas alpina]QNQ09574.1 type VI secretion system membrane subunit TssM [Sphingomonas alpina]